MQKILWVCWFNCLRGQWLLKLDMGQIFFFFNFRLPRIFPLLIWWNSTMSINIRSTIKIYHRLNKRSSESCAANILTKEVRISGYEVTQRKLTIQDPLTVALKLETLNFKSFDKDQLQSKSAICQLWWSSVYVYCEVYCVMTKNDQLFNKSSPDIARSLTHVEHFNKLQVF